MVLLNCMGMFFLCGAIQNPVSRARGTDLRVYDIVSHYFLKIRRVKLVIALKRSSFSHDGFHRSSENFHFDIEWHDLVNYEKVSYEGPYRYPGHSYSMPML